MGNMSEPFGCIGSAAWRSYSTPANGFLREETAAMTSLQFVGVTHSHTLPETKSLERAFPLIIQGYRIVQHKDYEFLCASASCYDMNHGLVCPMPLVSRSSTQLRNDAMWEMYIRDMTMASAI